VTTPSGATDPGMLGDWYTQYMQSGAAPASQATTTDWNVANNQTVQGQVADITKADGVLMQQAATRANQQSSGRGLLNSSLGVQAGQAALYDAAMPMAMQDAGTFADAAKTNAGERNTTSRFNADAKNFRNMGMFDAATGIYRDTAQQQFQAGENALDRTFTTSERLGTQSYNSSENVAQRSWQTGERVAGQTFTAGETALNRAWQSGERIGAQNFGAAQATLDRDQQEKIVKLQQEGATKLQATEIASRERMQIAQQTFDSEQLGKEQAFIVQRDAQAFENQLALIDQNTGTNLAADYRAESTKALTAYQSSVTAIQLSDMDEDVKVAQIAALGTIYQTQMTFTNTLFENAPGWSDEWSTIEPEFEED
jgi:hypothetical protein